MVHRTYLGLGTGEAAVRVFDGLAPFARQLFEMEAECEAGPDRSAMGIALDGLTTCAFHFTRRPYFYMAIGAEVGTAPALRNGRLKDRAEAIAAFEALAPYSHQLVLLKGRCRPFGRDYLALEIAQASLGTAAYHFTGDPAFYGARNDTVGPIRPPR